MNFNFDFMYNFQTHINLKIKNITGIIKSMVVEQCLLDNLFVNNQI
jgi:hypothetical protein